MVFHFTTRPYLNWRTVCDCVCVLVFSSLHVQDLCGLSGESEIQCFCVIDCLMVPVAMGLFSGRFPIVLFGLSHRPETRSFFFNRSEEIAEFVSYTTRLHLNLQAFGDCLFGICSAFAFRICLGFQGSASSNDFVSAIV